VPSEAYQYDLVYECFANDKEFQRYWKVPKNGFARCSTDESISQKNCYIRVVMDLEPGVKLYPTAYTPGFPTVPRDVSDSELQRNSAASSSRKIAGLPEGYSVALDVYILKDAEILLKHQRAFRGRVDAAYRWLDAIANPGIATEELESGELALIDVTPMENSIIVAAQTLADTVSSVAKHWTWHSTHIGTGAASAETCMEGYPSNPNPRAVTSLHEVIQPSARETLPLSCLNACPRGLAVDPRLDEVGKRLQDFRKEIHNENALINAFGDHAGLPTRDTGTSWGNKADEGALQRDIAYKDETARLDRALEDLWARTVDSTVIQDETTI